MRNKLPTHINRKITIIAGVLCMFALNGCLPVIAGHFLTKPLQTLWENTSEPEQKLASGPITINELLAKARGSRAAAPASEPSEPPDDLKLLFSETDDRPTPKHLAILGRYLTTNRPPHRRFQIFAGPGAEKDTTAAMLTGMRRASHLSRLLKEVGITSQVSFDPNSIPNSLRMSPMNDDRDDDGEDDRA